VQSENAYCRVVTIPSAWCKRYKSYISLKTRCVDQNIGFVSSWELHEQFQLEFIWNTCVSVTKKQLALSYLSLKMESSAGEATEDCSDVLPEGSYICFIWGLKMNCHLSLPSSAGYEQWAISTSTFRHCVCVLFRSLQCPWVVWHPAEHL